MITWNNLDTLESFKELSNVKKVNLVEAMTGENGAERVKNYSVPMAAGLAYNYAAKQVDDNVLEGLKKLAKEALAEKTVEASKAAEKPHKKRPAAEGEKTSAERPAQPKKKKKNNIRVPYVNNQNGEMYQAIFTDGYELQRFDPKKRLRPVVVKFDDLEKFLVKDAKGFLLNPTSTALPLRREQLPAFKKRIDG